MDYPRQLKNQNNRGEKLTYLQNEFFDVIIIGGGVTGAGIALDAQSKGLKCLLLEMQDFASGTSSRSTKLVHGGLRYLKQLEFSLVAEVGRERAIVYKNCMHITRPEQMLLPITKNGSINKLIAWFGLWFYDFLAGVKKSERRKMLSKSETAKIEPLLISNSLIGGALYTEYRTDDARLTLELVKTAADLGALAFNYCKVEEFIYQNDLIVGVKVKDLLNGNIYNFKSHFVVNAGGPWVDEIDLKDKNYEKKLILTKGIHIVIDSKKLPLKTSIYFDHTDGRMIFAIPREGKVYIGTTDTVYTGDYENPLIYREDQQYLLHAVNQYFNNISLSLQDIESGWAGLRPLLKKQGQKNVSAISRKDEIFEMPSGLIVIAGGKLTGYRKMAEKVSHILIKRIKRKQFKFESTKNIKLCGGNFNTRVEFEHFVNKNSSELIQYGLNEEEAKTLIYRYGSSINLLKPYLASEEYKSWDLPLFLFAQLQYSLKNEYVCTPADFFVRRTGALYFNIQWVENYYKKTIYYLKNYFDWSDMESNHFELEMIQRIKEAKGPINSN